MFPEILTFPNLGCNFSWAVSSSQPAGQNSLHHFFPSSPTISYGWGPYISPLQLTTSFYPAEVQHLLISHLSLLHSHLSFPWGSTKARSSIYESLPPALFKPLPSYFSPLTSFQGSSFGVSKNSDVPLYNSFPWHRFLNLPPLWKSPIPHLFGDGVHAE